MYILLSILYVPISYPYDSFYKNMLMHYRLGLYIVIKITKMWCSLTFNYKYIDTFVNTDKNNFTIFL